MSPYAIYVKEREGLEVLEDGRNFIEYLINGQYLEIHGIHVDPSERRQGKGTELAERVIQIGREAGCKMLVAEIVLNYLNCTESMKFCLSFGSRLQSAQNNRIMMVREIGEK